MNLKKTIQIVLLLTGSYAIAQLGVGTATPNTSAQLEVISTDKGILIPRVALASETDVATITNGNVESLMVYNTGDNGTVTPGYYYWANGGWNRLVVQSDIASLPADVTSTNGSITGVAVDAALAAMDLEVHVDNATLEVDATNGVQVSDNGIVTAKIANNAVDGTKIQVIGEVQGAMLFNDGTDWISLPNGTAGQLLTMNAAGDAPEWISPAVNGPSPRIGEFVYAKSGRTVVDGYLSVSPGNITNGAVDYPLWAAQYPEFVSGNDIVFPADVNGMFLRNLGGNADTEGIFQDYRTARPTGKDVNGNEINKFETSMNGSHRHRQTFGRNQADNNVTGRVGDNAHFGYTTIYGSMEAAGDHTHTIDAGGDVETNPVNWAYQLYTIVDTYQD